MNKNLDNFVNEATGQNADGSNLTGEQLVAIRKAGELGKRLQEDFPEIADEYRNGRTMPEISLEYCIQELYDAKSRAVAINAVRYALGGYDFGGISYSGLIEDLEELKNIGLEHGREQRTENGNANYEKGLGVHGLTPEQRTENGKATYEMGLGVHGLTAEQIAENSRKGGNANYEMGLGVHGLTAEQIAENGRKGVMARGFVPWVPAEETKEYYTFSEAETALRLAKCSEYRRGSLIKNAKIAGELNVIFHNEEPVRNEKAVSAQLYLHQKNMREVIS